MKEPRKIALRVLGEVLGGVTSPRNALKTAGSGLDKRDKAFITELAYGVLRNLYLLDWALAKFLKKPGGLGPRTTNNLRLGAYQALMMRVPEWAAVSEAVGLEIKSPALVNGVLRNLIRQKDAVDAEIAAMREAASAAGTNEKERIRLISTLTSHPRWLIKRWATRFGPGEAFELAEASNRIPPLTLRTNTLRTTRDALMSTLRERSIDASATPLSPEGIKLAGTLPMDEIAGLIGEAYVQDEGAQMISHLLNPSSGERVLDACSAPGGKATHLAQLMGDRGEVLALERDPARAERLGENVGALGLKSVRVVVGDLLEFNAEEHGGAFNKVMLDAPCSSLGVARRNPDVKYRHKEADLARFGALQGGLLAAAARLLKPGGLLCYCTCSTEPEEGEDVVAEFLKTSGDSFKLEGVPGNMAALPGGGEFWRTYPHRGDMDGFFGARLRKTK